MSATVVLDSKASDDTKVVIRPDLKRNGNPKPSDEEIAGCGPARMIIVVVFCLGLIGMLVAAIVIIAISPKCAPKQPPVPLAWWKRDHFYSIYVPSFQDTDNNGFGDLQGVVKRLDYLKRIGAKTVVLSGVINMNDFKGVDPNVGLSDDFKELVNALKEAGIKIVVAFNPTVTGIKHPWFISSINATSPERSFFFWRQTIANNWKNTLGWSAWAKDPSTAYYYYSYLGDNTASLNLLNRDVDKALRDVLKHWVTVNQVNGFMLEGVSRLVVDEKLRDSTGTVQYDKDQQESHTILKSWNKLLDEHGAILVGYPDSANASSYYGTSSEKELHLVLSRHFASSKDVPSANALNSTLLTEIASVPTFAWPGWIMGGRRLDRLATRYSASEATAKLLVIMHLTLPGTVVSWYGDELLLKNQGGESASIMQWNNQTNAGFTSVGSPWLPLNGDYKDNNVENNFQTDSLLKVFEELSLLRSKEPSLSGPQFDVVYASQQVIIYYRAMDNVDKFLIALNFGTSPASNISLANNKFSLTNGQVILDTTFKLNQKLLAGKLPQLYGGHGLVVKIAK